MHMSYQLHLGEGDFRDKGGVFLLETEQMVSILIANSDAGTLAPSKNQICECFIYPYKLQAKNEENNMW